MRTVLFCLVTLTLVLIFSVGAASATEAIADATGYDCGYCHLDPSGGGELTPAGTLYLEQAVQDGNAQETGVASKLFRLLVGYLHLLFAVLWFGTILYVHIVLKPAYAAKGLPTGEKKVGILSFFVVGITGVILALYRIPSWEQLFATRFGILLVVKVFLYLLMLISAIFVIKVIGPRLKKPSRAEHREGDDFTAETLSNFDGQEGRPCYFAYDGKVYDASASKMWAGGQHMKRHSAGVDLTEVLALAPHQAEVMERLPVVGDFKAEAKSIDHDAQTFYYIAYMNLTIVFLILFIIAIWKWW